MVETIQKKTSVLAILSLVFGCFFLIPLLGFAFSIPALVLGIIALVNISKEDNNLKGRGLAISGIVLGSVGIILVPFIVLLSAIAVPNLLRARVSANEALAKATVRTISTAIETYATGNNGKYPISESPLVEGNIPYLSKSYDNQVISGYKYLLKLNTNSYKVVAKPEACGSSGTKVIVAETGGVIQEEGCN